MRFASKKIIIMFVLAAVLYLSHYFGFAHYTGQLFVKLVNPLLSSANYIGDSLGDFFSLYSRRYDFERENEILRTELINSVKKNLELRLALEENNYLREEMKFLSDFKYDSVIARVIGQTSIYDKASVIIDRGSGSGIRPGNAVTTNAGVIIGRVVKVEKNISHVQFITSNESKLSAYIMSDYLALGVIMGEHNINLKMDMLPKDIFIMPGDSVATSGLDEHIPAGLLIGEVNRVDNIEEKFWQTAVLNPPIDYLSVRMVTVILD